MKKHLHNTELAQFPLHFLYCALPQGLQGLPGGVAASPGYNISRGLERRNIIT
jgi:hypothetical protein